MITPLESLLFSRGIINSSGLEFVPKNSLKIVNLSTAFFTFFVLRTSSMQVSILSSVGAMDARLKLKSLSIEVANFC